MTFNIYILGKNSFIAKNLYLKLKPKINNIFLLSHNEIEKIQTIAPKDILVNCCGVNRSNTFDDYNNGNFIFVQKIINNIKKTKPFFIHISSLMVYGFKNKKISDLSEYKQWFIQTKLKAENFIKNNYENHCIIRPSNIYGYSCQPYYNNLLSTMVYEKIKGLKRINKLNINCIRNMISIENVCNEIINIMLEKRHNIYNIISNNYINLKDLCSYLYDGNIPIHINIETGLEDVPNIDKEKLPGENIIIVENLKQNIKDLETSMKNYIYLEDNINMNVLNKLSQERGDMIEISSLQSKRLYKITLNKHSIRGNHFHFKQIEEFYNNIGKVTYILSTSNDINTRLVLHTNKNTKIYIQPYIIHTVVNDFVDNIPEIIISSTQEYIQNSVPDTKYINLL
jgi:dTDP-4-dehydrorhamnose reductase